MVYYFQATGLSGLVDPPVILYMGKHKEESMYDIVHTLILESHTNVLTRRTVD